MIEANDIVRVGEVQGRLHSIIGGVAVIRTMDGDTKFMLTKQLHKVLPDGQLRRIEIHD